MEYLKKILPEYVLKNGAALVMLEALMYFCFRFENGTVQSKTTYAKYIEIIENVTLTKWIEIRENVSLEDVE